MNVLLALYPNNLGMGYACVAMPKILVDAAIVNIRPLCNGKLLTRAEKIIEFYKPALIVIRDTETLQTKGERNRRLIKEIESLAVIKNLPVFHYSRRQIKDVFEMFGARSKFEISQKIVEWFPELKEYAPPRRKLWSSEEHYTGLFDAMSLAITHEYLKE